jgi:hypothetical protein
MGPFFLEKDGAFGMEEVWENGEIVGVKRLILNGPQHWNKQHIKANYPLLA